MKLEISQSSILASREIVKDNKIANVNKRLHEHNLSTYEYSEGKKAIKIFGEDEFIKLNEYENDFFNYRRELRKLIMKIVKYEKDSSIYSIPKGSVHYLPQISENFRQVFTDAGLDLKIDNSEEGKEIRDWWMNMQEFVRNLIKEKQLEAGDDGESKTFEYEIKRLSDLSINKEPVWESVHDQLLGYDVQSWDKNLNKIFIESKASSKSSGEFHFSRYAWISAKKEKEKYYVYLWIKNNSTPRIIDYIELSEYLSIFDELKEKNSFWKNLKITPKGKN